MKSLNGAHQEVKSNNNKEKEMKKNTKIINYFQNGNNRRKVKKYWGNGNKKESFQK